MRPCPHGGSKPWVTLCWCWSGPHSISLLSSNFCPFSSHPNSSCGQMVLKYKVILPKTQTFFYWHMPHTHLSPLAIFPCAEEKGIEWKFSLQGPQWSRDAVKLNNGNSFNELKPNYLKISILNVLWSHLWGTQILFLQLLFYKKENTCLRIQSVFLKIITIFYSIHQKGGSEFSLLLYHLVNILNCEELECEPDTLGLPASLFSFQPIFRSEFFTWVRCIHVRRPVKCKWVRSGLGVLPNVTAALPAPKLCIMWSLLKTMKEKLKQFAFCEKKVREDWKANSGLLSTFHMNFIQLGNEITLGITVWKKFMNPLVMSTVLGRMPGTVHYQRENHFLANWGYTVQKRTQTYIDFLIQSFQPRLEAVRWIINPLPPVSVPLPSLRAELSSRTLPWDHSCGDTHFFTLLPTSLERVDLFLPKAFPSTAKSICRTSPSFTGQC